MLLLYISFPAFSSNAPHFSFTKLHFVKSVGAVRSTAEPVTGFCFQLCPLPALGMLLIRSLLAPLMMKINTIITYYMYLLASCLTSILPFVFMRKPATGGLRRSPSYTMSFDQIFDLTAGVYFYFYNICKVADITRTHVLQILHSPTTLLE